MADVKEILAKKIVRFREGVCMNQMDFAEDCGISRNLLSLIETGKDNVTINTMDLLSARMGISIGELLSQDGITYFVYPSEIVVEDVRATTYGIGVLIDNTLVDYILDVSLDFDKIKTLVSLLNLEELEPIHLKDIVEDVVWDD